MSTEDDAATYLNVEGLDVMSRGAFGLHTFAITDCITDGRPGFVSDEYLIARQCPDEPQLLRSDQ
jgi:hypothetical protein